MHVIVLHKKQLSETEMDRDIYICGNMQELVSFRPPPPPPPPPVLIFTLNVAVEALTRKSSYRCSLF